MKLTKNMLAQLIRKELHNSKYLTEQEENMTMQEPMPAMMQPGTVPAPPGADLQPEILEVMKGILKALDKLDTSIDYLAAVATGESAFGIQASQSALGRFAAPPGKEEERSEEQKYGAELEPRRRGPAAEEIAQLAADRAAEATTRKRK